MKNTASLSTKVMGVITVVLGLTGVTLKIFETNVAFANTILHFSIAFAISVFIYGICNKFDKKK